MKSKRAESSRQRKKESKKRKRRIEAQNRVRQWPDEPKPMFKMKKANYEFSERSIGVSHGGIGAIHNMSQWLGLPDEINRSLHLLKYHKPYWESDHVTTFAYNSLCGGTCLEDLERLRNDEGFVKLLGASRIPDPTTAGDFCRRFAREDIDSLQDAINRVRRRVWEQQPAAFFDEARIDVDGTIVETTGECKGGMDISYNGKWGYNALLVSLANTREPLFLGNRPANRPSHDGASEYIDRAIDVCREAGFRRIEVRGDTDFTQTKHLDGWDAEDVFFIFGFDARSNVIGIAQSLPERCWSPLSRRRKYEVKTSERARPEVVKEKVIRRREFVNIKLIREHVAEFEYRPTLCANSYRMIVVRKTLKVLKGQNELHDEVRYFFYLTNDWEASNSTIVWKANSRCEQENLIEQLKNGVRSLNAPVDNGESNWAYMVMTSLAWSLKSWFGLLLPEIGRWQGKHREEKWKVVRMEFKGFIEEFVRIPILVVSTGRKLMAKLISWNRWQHVFLRFLDVLQKPMEC